MTSTSNKVRGSRIAAAALLAPALFLSACGSPAPSGGGDGGGADSGEGGRRSGLRGLRRLMAVSCEQHGHGQPQGGSKVLR